ncbi:hypothetical protein [Lactobacillus terrae]|uniref:hypothetical protein n=1 Tax=Lactobacillus terrae TaxID=2269374 RepID=UPI000C1B6682|nr:hypothetical protein [Lactobacillus terrae]
MTERVFFNPGDAIANSHDFEGAMKSAEIFKMKNPTSSTIIVAKDVNNDKSFSIYFENDKKENSDDTSTIPYNIEKKL